MKRKDYTVETADLPLADLLTNEGQLEGVPANPRQITGPELDKLIASLRETPELLEGRGILCVPYGEQFVILGGNMRAEALRKMGETTAPCVIYRGLTAEKMREIVIKDNSSFGEWDFDALANAWDDLPLKDWGVNIPDDFDAKPIEPNTATEDDFDEDTDAIEVRCHKGDIWQLGDHRLMCGDSIDLEEVKKLMGALLT